MRNFTKTLLLAVAMLFIQLSAFGQLTIPASSPHAAVIQEIGISKVKIKYSRPAVRDRDIWGALVPYGYNDFGFGSSKAAPWRVGADENTTIHFSHPVKIEGKDIAAGSYGLHMALTEAGEVTVMFSKNTSSWGSYFYSEAEDALRITTKWEDHSHTEMLTFQFESVTANEAVVALLWEKKKIPFTITVNTSEIVMTSLADELRSDKGFYNQNFETAASYALNNGGDLDVAMTWIENSTPPSFSNLSIKSGILAKQGKTAEADKMMKEALPLGSALQVHSYGRQLIAEGDLDGAMEVFEMNAKMHNNAWPTQFGLGRIYSAKGDYKKAISYLEKAKKNAPVEASRERLQRLINQLKTEKDIN